MKTGITIFFILISVCSVISGCYGKKSVTENRTSEPLIGVMVHTVQDPFNEKVQNAINTAAHDTASLMFMNSEYDEKLQDMHIDTLIAAGAAGIAVTAVDRMNVTSLVEKARTADIPIVFFNREPETKDLHSYKKAYYVGSKAAEAGIMQGQIAVDYLKNNPQADKNNDTIIHYIMLTGEPNHQDTLLRTLKSIETIQAAGITVEALAEETAMWNYTQAKEKMAACIAKFGTKIELVLANNDEMALGAIAALQEAGFFSANNTIPVLGVDATESALEAVEKGLLLGTVLQDAQQQGNAVFELIYALAENRATFTLNYKIKSGKYIWIPYQMITKANVKNFRTVRHGELR